MVGDLRHPREPPQSTRVAIVGAGIAGLSAAWRLQRLGINDFVLLENGAQIGGTSLAESRDGFHYPWGAHYVPIPMRENRELIALLTEMGAVIGDDDAGQPIVRETILCREPEERVFANGRWHFGLYPSEGASDEEFEQLQRFKQQMSDWAGRTDDQGRRLFAIPMETGSDCDEVRLLDRISMKQWMLDHGYDSDRLRWLVDYACRDDYGLSIDQTSAWAGVFYFAARMSGDSMESQPVMTWPEGNGAIVDFLAKQVGDRIRTSHAVTEIAPAQDGSLQVMAYDQRAKVACQWRADDVIFAAPQFVAPHLIRDFRSAGRSGKAFSYGGWIVANLHLRSRPSESDVPMCWDNVIAESRSLGYVNSTHQIGLDHGATVLTWYYPLLDRDPRVSRTELMKLRWQDWVSVAVTDLTKAHPDIVHLIERVDVMRWGHAMIQPRVGFVWGGERERACESLGRIHFAASDLSGVALMEEAFDRGIRAAQRCVAP